MKNAKPTFPHDDRFTADLKYREGRYTIIVDCADDLTADERMQLQACLETVTGFLQLNARLSDDEVHDIQPDSEAMHNLALALRAEPDEEGA